MVRQILIYTLSLILAAVASVHAETSLTLNACKKMALENNTRIKNGSLEIESAKKDKEIAFTKYFPQASISAHAFRLQDPLIDESIPDVNLPVYDGNPVNLGSASDFAYFPGTDIEALEKGMTGVLLMSQPLYAGGRITTGNKLAGLGIEVNLLKQKIIRDQVLLETEEQYWRIVTLHEKMETILRYETLLENLSQQVADAYKAGLTLRNDVLKVRQKRIGVQLNKSELENGIQLATMAFCQHIGLDYDPAITLGDRVQVDSSPEALYIHGPDRITLRPEYKLLTIAVKAQQLKAKLKKGETLPQLGIGAGIFYSQIDDSDWYDNATIFASARIPISDWWGHSIESKKSKLQEKIVTNDKNEKKALLLLQMEKAWKDLQNVNDHLSLCELSMTQAKENYAISKDSYINGMVDLSDLLEAQAIVQTAEAQMIEARIEYRIREMHYLHATGRKF